MSNHVMTTSYLETCILPHHQTVHHLISMTGGNLLHLVELLPTLCSVVCLVYSCNLMPCAVLLLSHLDTLIFDSKSYWKELIHLTHILYLKVLNFRFKKESLKNDVGCIKTKVKGIILLCANIKLK